MSDPLILANARLCEEVDKELIKSERKHKPLNGPQEGFIVIFDELYVLWEEVQTQGQDRPSMRKEALRVAATALRFIKDVCDREGENK